MSDVPLLPLILLSSSLTIYGEIEGRRPMVYVFKPLTTVLILALAVTLPAEPGSRYRTAILIGLVLSLAGDVFLMLPSDPFIAGVIAFLAAHVAYLVAFTTYIELGTVPAALIAIGLVVGLILATLWNRLPPPLRPPLVIYAVVLAAMAAQALSQAIVLRSTPAVAAALGGLLFLASDSLLVTNRFARPLRRAPLLVLGAYYAAQTLIATSVVVAP